MARIVRSHTLHCFPRVYKDCQWYPLALNRLVDKLQFSVKESPPVPQFQETLLM
ncbi:MAG: hypothetical protein MHMPM18_001524 [Marteilia pararefringens]